MIKLVKLFESPFNSNWLRGGNQSRRVFGFGTGQVRVELGLEVVEIFVP